MRQANAVVDFLSKMEKNEPTKEVFNELPDATLLSITQSKEGDWYENMVSFLVRLSISKPMV